MTDSLGAPPTLRRDVASAPMLPEGARGWRLGAACVVTCALAAVSSCSDEGEPAAATTTTIERTTTTTAKIVELPPAAPEGPQPVGSVVGPSG